MSTHLIFILAVLLTTVLVVLTLMSRLLRSAHRQQPVHNDANARIYQEQLAELQTEHQEGRLTATAFEQACDELTRRLLRDTEGAADPQPAPRTRALMSAMLIGVLLPLGAVATYLALGETDALDPQKVQAAAEQHPELQTMAESLARKLETEGGTVQRWMMLARTYRTLEQYDKALPAYAQAVALGGGDDVQLERAEVLAITRGGNFQGEPLQVIEKVLRKNPHHYQALLLAGSAAYAESRLQQALTYWQKAQAQLQPSDGDTDELNQAIAKVKEQLGQQPDKPTTPPAASTLSGRVELGELARGQFAASDTVFVYATATQGPRAPLAIVRTTVAQLPMSFVLDDTTAMNAEHKLSGQSAVWVKARVSKSGQAMPQPGDWVGTIGPVVPGSKDIRLVINEKLP